MSNKGQRQPLQLSQQLSHPQLSLRLGFSILKPSVFLIKSILQPSIRGTLSFGTAIVIPPDSVMISFFSHFLIKSM